MRRKQMAKWPRSGILVRALAVCGLLLVSASAVAGQNGQNGRYSDSAREGRIAGSVVADGTGEPLANVEVVVEGVQASAVTDLDGRYLIASVPAGNHTVVARSLGYASKTITEVSVNESAAATLDIVMTPEALALEAITVTATAERGSSAFLLDQRRTGAALVDAIGSSDIARSPDSDAAEVAMRLVGTTVSEGKYVFVRGLGERYSQTSLNGSPLPSPEPEREVVPLDLFPAGFLESLTAQKTYTPDLPGDFSGGSVNIETLEFPSQLQGSISIGTSFNTNSHFRDDFLSYPGGDLDFLGIDDGTRDLPDLVEETLGETGRIPTNDSVERERLGEAFPKTFTPRPKSTPLNRNLGFSIGNRLDIGDRELGFVVAATYSDSYTHQPDEIERKWRATDFNPNADRRAANADYVFTTSTRNINWGTIANLSFLLSPTDKLSLKTTYNRNADDEGRIFTGANREDLSADIESDRLRFVSRSMLWSQLSGEHRTFLDSRFEWRVTGARATRYEPGLRQAIYERSFTASEEEPRTLRRFNESGRYFYSDLIDDDLSGQIDWELPINVWRDREGSIKLGGMLRRRDRDFDARRFNWLFNNSVIADDIESALTDDAIVGTAATASGEFVIDDVFQQGDRYDVRDRRSAAYAMMDLPVTDGLRAVIGARVERYTLDLDADDVTLAENERTDVLPAVNLTYALNPGMNLRAAASRTIERPEARELAPFVFTEATSLRQLIGNPNLDVARVSNFDLRWEWFPRAGEVVSLGGFYKAFEDPIEQVAFAAAGTAWSFQNAEDGHVAGVELEVRSRLDFVAPWLESVTAGVNTTFIDSEVNVVESGAFIPTNAKRSLEGQASHVVNASLIYTAQSGLEAGVFFNRTGERVSAAGGSGLPDVFERARDQLDATLGLPAPGRMKFKVKATNLLGTERIWDQTANGVTLIQRQYDPGQGFSVSLSRSF